MILLTSSVEAGCRIISGGKTKSSVLSEEHLSMLSVSLRIQEEINILSCYFMERHHLRGR
jgi:hypothetical protein